MATSGAVELTVVTLPAHALSFSNCVYMNREAMIEMGLLSTSPDGSFVELTKSKHIFKLASHPKLNAGELGMNGLQRRATGLSSGFQVSLRPVDLVGTKEPSLIRLVLKMDYKSKRKGFLSEDDVAKDILSKYEGQVFHLDQPFAFEFSGYTMVMTVQTCQKAQKTETKTASGPTPQADYANVARGVLASFTSVEVVADSTNKLLEWKPSAANMRTNVFKKNWNFQDLGIGGLDEEFGHIFRRSFASRLFPPQIIEAMGISHVKGMLLYGPPGTGKTLIARQIGKILDGHEPKVVNGPEVLNKYVGASEENIRKLFEDAEEEYKEKGDASTLHIIIFDEIDAICKARGSVRSGTGVHDTIVNQLLSKIDGVDSLNNILIIGMTNRKDLIDSALLRPGRLEVHVEIGLPDEKGREQILEIHTRKMREAGKLGDDVDLARLATLTKNFSGAEIGGLVKSATSFALYGVVDLQKMSEVGGDAFSGLGQQQATALKVCMEHFIMALDEVIPSFGAASEHLDLCLRGGFYNHGAEFEKVIQTGQTLIRQVQNSEQTPIMSLLLHGPDGAGATAMAAYLAKESEFPFVKMITPEDFVGYSETNKAHKINEVFEDAYKSSLSLIIVDSVERLLDYVPIGPRFSNHVLQSLLVLLKKVPPNADRRIMIICTTSEVKMMTDLQLMNCFNVQLAVPTITEADQVKKVVEESGTEVDAADLDKLCERVPYPIGIKSLLMLLEMAAQTGAVTADSFARCVANTGLDKWKKKESTMTYLAGLSSLDDEKFDDLA